MSEYQRVINLAQRAERDGALRQALQRCQSVEDAVQVAADAGVPVSADELRAFSQHVQKLQQRCANGELSDVELEAVAGGLFMTTMLTLGIVGLTGAGVATGVAGVGAGVAGIVHAATNK